MSLAESLTAPPSAFPTRCGVALVLTNPDISSEDMRAIRDAINNHRVTAEHISRQLIEHGWRLSGDSIRRHRRGVCRCD